MMWLHGLKKMEGMHAFPPSECILTYRSCKAFGNHYRVFEDNYLVGFTTFDVGIVCIVAHESRCSSANRNVWEECMSHVKFI